jgi:hypothetical protein
MYLAYFFLEQKKEKRIRFDVFLTTGSMKTKKKKRNEKKKKNAGAFTFTMHAYLLRVK